MGVSENDEFRMCPLARNRVQEHNMERPALSVGNLLPDNASARVSCRKENASGEIEFPSNQLQRIVKLSGNVYHLVDDTLHLRDHA